jgi:CelD/BcsL family acetyltransferase involved in cellulose biosynthesis
VTSIDAAPRLWPGQTTRHFTVECFGNGDLTAACWPSISAGPEFRMHVYQSREFLDVWMATVGKARGAECFLVVVKNQDKTPVLYLPLTIETKFNVRILRFMDGGVTDFNAPIVVADHDLTRSEFIGVWNEILALLPAIDVIDLQKIASQVSTARNPLTYLDCVAYETSGHSIELRALHDDPGRSPSIGRMQKKFRRQLRRLGELGPAEFQINPSLSKLDKVMGGLIDLKRKHYLRTSGRDFFAMPGIYDFYSEMMQPSRLGRISHLSALTCGDDVVSAHLGFIGRNRFYYVLPAFDTRYRSLAVGHLLLDHLITHCAEQDYTTFDLGEGDFAYKKKWATQRQQLLSYERAMSATGVLYRQLRRVRRAVGINMLSEFYAKGRMRGSAVLHAVRACRQFQQRRWGNAAVRPAPAEIRST